MEKLKVFDSIFIYSQHCQQSVLYTQHTKSGKYAGHNSNNINSKPHTYTKPTSTRHNLFDFEFFKCFILTNRNHKKNNLFLCITTRHLCNI